MNKRILAVILTLLLGGLMLAACTPATTSDSDTAAAGQAVTLRVWGPQEEQALLQEMCEAFAAAHPEDTYTFEYGVVSEADAATRYSEDPSAAADVFYFSNDQLRTLVQAGGLYEVTRNKDDIVARNISSSVESATMDDLLYAYPMTADNGYFMYYDKSVFTQEDVQTLDGMLKAAGAAGKQILMDIKNGWYLASFFLGNGGTLSINDEGRQECDFNNANGLAAAEAIRAFCNNDAYTSGDDNVLTGGIGNSIAAGVSGTWNAEAIQERLGENYAATKLPTFTVNGQQVQMASFGGYKLVGVNSLTAYPVQAMDLADWLTNEENQMKRFDTRQLGPSNNAAAASDAVQQNIALAALAAQSQFAFSQNDVLSSFWEPTKAFGTEMENRSTRDLQELLDLMVNQITA